jgi:hypothetical protein
MICRIKGKETVYATLNRVVLIFYHGNGNGTEPGIASSDTHAVIANIAARPFCNSTKRRRLLDSNLNHQ